MRRALLPDLKEGSVLILLVIRQRFTLFIGFDGQMRHSWCYDTGLL